MAMFMNGKEDAFFYREAALKYIGTRASCGAPSLGKSAKALPWQVGDLPISYANKQENKSTPSLIYML